MWLAGLGAAVLSAFSVTGASVFASMVVGSIVVGAAVGAIYSAVTGSNILRGMLYGSLAGLVLGAGAYALGFGAPAAMGTGLAPVGSVGAGLGSSVGTGAGVGAGLGAAGAGTGVTASLFSVKGLSAIGTIGTLGSQFLMGSQAGADRDAELAQREKELQAQRELAELNNRAAYERAMLAVEAQAGATAAQERTAANQLRFEREKFQKEFAELQFQDRDTRQKEERNRQQNITGIGEVPSRLSMPTVTLAEAVKQRENLPAPPWRPAQQPAQGA